MALPHVRSITVDAVVYAWIASGNGLAGDYGAHTLRLFIEQRERPGCRLRATFAPDNTSFA